MDQPHQKSDSELARELLRSHIRDVPDFPKPGILFKDITPLLASPQGFREVVAAMSEPISFHGAEAIVGLEARGFIFGAAVAYRLGLPFLPVRKVGKLPAQSIRVDYELEYASAAIEMHVDSLDGLPPGARVAIADDLLATGGTTRATCELVSRLGGTVSVCSYAIELGFLDARRNLPEGCLVESLLVLD